MAAQGPGAPAGSAKVPAKMGATERKKMPRNLFCERIPDADAEVVKIRTPRIPFIAEIDTAYGARVDPDRRWQAGWMDANPRAGFHKIRPILPPGVNGEVLVPEELGAHFPQRPGVTDAVLIVVEEIVIEMADVDAVGGGLEKQAAALAAERRAPGSRIRDAAAVIAPVSGVQIANGDAGFE